MRIHRFHGLAGIAGVVAVALLRAGFGIGVLVPCIVAAAASGVLAAGPQRARQRPRARPEARPPRRDEHLARTVHELRTPLCTIAAALELLRTEPDLDRHPAAVVVEDALLATDQLTHLVADVLDDAALTAGRLRLAVGSHRVSALLEDCVRLLRRQAERNGRRLELAPVDADLAVRTDPRRFLQIAGNLVRNALAAAPAGTAVRLEVHADRHRLRFTVVDRGPGVHHDVRARLFTSFATGPKSGGTGLGLHVSMRLVQQMGGRIGHAATEQGTTFWFELPRALPRTVAPGTGAARQPGSQVPAGAR